MNKRRFHYSIFNVISVLLVIGIIFGFTYIVCRSWAQEFDSWTMEERIKY